MFDRAELERVLELQEKSYGLLLWLNKSLRENRRLFSTVHEAMSLFDAGKKWIRDHYDQLPEKFRPDAKNLDAFAHLFTSYLATSFEIAARIRVSDGCSCLFCTYFYDAKHLRARNPNKKAHAEALQIKRMYLEGLGIDANKALATREATVATYAHELVRRSKFASQGEGILVLWRELGQMPTADEVLQAEKSLLES